MPPRPGAPPPRSFAPPQSGTAPPRRRPQPQIIAAPNPRKPGSSGLRLWLARPAVTGRLGELLAADAQPGDILALAGPLGAGKTCLVAGLARGLGIRGTVASPSFSLVNQHEGRLRLHHVDLYRLGHASELAELGLWEAAESGGLLAIEWLERFPDAVDADRLDIALSYHSGAPPVGAAAAGQKAASRIAELRAGGPRSAARLVALLARLSG